MASKREIAAREIEKGKYINPFTDFGFKRLFGTEANKDFLQHFLQALLHLEGQITQLNYLNNARLGRLKHERGAVFDIYCETDTGEKFIVEMQKSEQKFFKDRSVFYSTFPIQEQAKRGHKWNFELHAIYTVAVLDFEFDDDKDDPDKYYYHVQLSDTDTQKVFFEKLTFVYLEMPKFTKSEEELETVFDKWLFVLKNLQMLQKRPKALQGHVFQKLFQVAAVEKLTAKERKSYDESLKNYWDLQNVIDTAVEKAVEKAVKAQVEILTEKDEAIKEKDEAIKAKDQAIKAKDQTIKAKDQALAENAKTMAAMKKEIEELQRQLQK